MWNTIYAYRIGLEVKSEAYIMRMQYKYCTVLAGMLFVFYYLFSVLNVI